MQANDKWVRKFGEENLFAIQTTIWFGDSLEVEPYVQQTVWIGGAEFKDTKFDEFSDAANQTAQTAQFNGQRRVVGWDKIDASTVFNAVWAVHLERPQSLFFDHLSAERLTPRLYPLVRADRYCVVIGTMDYRLRFLCADDSMYLVNPAEIEMRISDFEVPLAETMAFFETVAKLCKLDWRDVLMGNYRSCW